MRVLLKVLRGMSRGVNVVSMCVTSVLIVALVLLAFAGVISRELGHSLSWNEELESYIFIWISCIGSAIAYRYMGHPAVNVVSDRLPASLRPVVRALADLAVIAFAAAFFWYGIQMTGFESTETASSFNMPMSYFYIALPIGGVLLMLHALLFFAEDFDCIFHADRARMIEVDRATLAGGE